MTSKFVSVEGLENMKMLLVGAHGLMSDSPHKFILDVPMSRLIGVRVAVWYLFESIF